MLKKLLVSVLPVVLVFAGPVGAVDYSLNAKYVCRITEGGKPALLSAAKLKPSNFATVLKKASKKIESASATVKRLTKSGASKAKIAAAKAKLAAAKADKKLISDCKKGKVSSNPQPTPTVPPQGDLSKISGTFEEKFGAYSTNGQDRCAFFTFFKWPDVPGAVFNKITFDRNVNNPPAIPTERDVAPPYEDVYTYTGINGNVVTGISFTVEPGFHWVQFGRFDSFGEDCTSEERRAEIAAFRAGSNANGFAHRAN